MPAERNSPWRHQSPTSRPYTPSTISPSPSLLTGASATPITPIPPQIYYLPAAALVPSSAPSAESTHPVLWDPTAQSAVGKPLYSTPASHPSAQNGSHGHSTVPSPLAALSAQSGQRRASDPVGVTQPPTGPFAVAYDPRTHQPLPFILGPPRVLKVEQLQGWNEHIEQVQNLRKTLHQQNALIDTMREAIDHALAIEQGRAPPHSHPNTPGHEDMLLNSSMRTSAKTMAEVLRGARSRLRANLRNRARRDTHHAKINALQRAEEAHKMMWEAIHEVMGTVPSLQTGLARYYTPATTESLDADIEAGEAALAAGETTGEDGSDDEWDHVPEEQDSDVTLTGDEEEYYWSDDE